YRLAEHPADGDRPPPHVRPNPSAVKLASNVSWFDQGTVSSSRPARAKTARAAVVKAGRRPDHPTRPNLARPRLGEGEHAVMLLKSGRLNGCYVRRRGGPDGRGAGARDRVPASETELTPTRRSARLLGGAVLAAHGAALGPACENLFRDRAIDA